MTLPNQEPFFSHTCSLICIGVIFLAFFSACLFIECIHCRGPIGPPLRNYEPLFSLSQRTATLMPLQWMTITRTHMGSPPMRNHYGVKAVSSLCKCNLALLRLAPMCCCAISECLLWGWGGFGVGCLASPTFPLSLSVCQRLGGIWCLFIQDTCSIISELTHLIGPVGDGRTTIIRPAEGPPLFARQ